MTRRIHWVLVAVLAGCAKSPPPSEPTVSVSDPPARDPETETPPPRTPPPRSGVPEGPWRVSYHDGSGNQFRFENTDGSVSYTYSLVTPERSSSGTYSGGTPVAGKLVNEHVVGLWKRLRELEAATEAHTGERAMGTGAFRIVTPAGEQSFILARGELLAAFDEFLLQMKLGN